MDIIEAINGRKSIRAFRPDPVPKEVIRNMLEAASNAPSWANTQPWEFAVLSLSALNKVRAAVNDKIAAGDKPNLDIPRPTFTDIYAGRTRTLAEDIKLHMDTNQTDSSAASNPFASLTQWFNAPSGVILYMDASLGDWSILDSGMALQNLMLAAWHCGVGTCVMAAAVHYPDVLRQVLNIPQSKRIIVGIAMGYPDFTNPVTSFRSNREPLERFVTWHGFE